MHIKTFGKILITIVSSGFCVPLITMMSVDIRCNIILALQKDFKQIQHITHLSQKLWLEICFLTCEEE